MTIKKNIKEIQKSLNIMNNCIEVEKRITKETLDEEIDFIQSHLNDLKKASSEMALPTPVLDPDLKRLREICEKYVEFIGRDDDYDDDDYYDDNDYEHSICEEALKTVFGEYIINWINRNTNS